MRDVTTAARSAVRSGGPGKGRVAFGGHGGAVRAVVLAAALAALLAAPARPARALEPAVVKLRVSVKRILDAAGRRPQGRWGDTSQITRTIGKSNTALRRSGSLWVLDLDEVVDVRGISRFYRLSTADVPSLEASAKADRTAYAWRTDAINIYVADEVSDAGGVCSFPTFGPHRDVIVINSRGVLGGSEGWLHEIGHYFNLIHTHEGDRVGDTVPDTPPPAPFDCGVHDRNFSTLAARDGFSPADTYNVLHNVMSYHCDPLVLTPLQLIRMRRALLDYRPRVVVPPPVPAAPVAEIRVEEAVAGSTVPFDGAETAIHLDGSASRDGDGGDLLTWRWEIAGGPPGGARFEGSPAGWRLGRSSFGYGDDDDFTEIRTMRGRFLSLYLVTTFRVADPAAFAGLTLDVLYDDGFAAYLNGVEVARRNLGRSAGNGTPALAAIEPQRELIDLGRFIDLLVEGENRIAIEVHNASLSSSDLSMHPVLTAAGARGDPVALVPTRAPWYYLEGTGDGPPPEWRSASFDPSGRTAVIRAAEPGIYRFRLEVDQGISELDGSQARSRRTAAAEVEVTVGGGGIFIRGDCNGDRSVDLSDALAAVRNLFSGRAVPCDEACDANDDGRRDVSDAITLLDFLFREGPPPPAPFPGFGLDDDADAVGCGP